MLNAESMSDTTAGLVFYGAAAEMAKRVDTMPKREREKVVRYMLRMINDCPKATRLTEQFEAGLISRQQFLAAM